jgi:nicotinic acid phosphoribosyltransferase
MSGTWLTEPVSTAAGKARSPEPAPGGLTTDVYELTMAASYLRRAMRGPATLSLFLRR